jgi:hypothetical protein
MTTQCGRKAMPPTDRQFDPSKQAKKQAKKQAQEQARKQAKEPTTGPQDAVPGLLEDIALAAAKIYYLTAGVPGPQHRLSTVEK